MLQSDRPRLITSEQELQNQMHHQVSKRFLFGQGPERMQINTELMKLRSDKPNTLQEYYFLFIRRSISKNEYFSLKYKIKSE